jgi:hypothetical protein
MNKLAIISCALTCCALSACDASRLGNSRHSSGSTIAPPSTAPGQTYSTEAGNSMPGTRGGFNNDEITGKSRNPYSTTPGTGPMNSNPVASGNAPR